MLWGQESQGILSWETLKWASALDVVRAGGCAVATTTRASGDWGVLGLLMGENWYGFLDSKQRHSKPDMANYQLGTHSGPPSQPPHCPQAKCKYTNYLLYLAAGPSSANKKTTTTYQDGTRTVCVHVCVNHDIAW
jgi:hypothetical protein